MLDKVYLLVDVLNCFLCAYKLVTIRSNLVVIITLFAYKSINLNLLNFKLICDHYVEGKRAYRIFKGHVT